MFVLTFGMIFGLMFIGSANAKILFYDDCEDIWDSNDWKINGAWYYYSDGRYGSGGQTTERSREGGGSYYFTQIPTAADCTNTACMHVMLNLINRDVFHFTFGKIFWLGYSVYIPSDYEPPTGYPEWRLISQWHGDDSCAPAHNPMQANGLDKNGGIAFSIKGIASCSESDDYDRREAYGTPPLIKGAWNDIVHEVRFSSDMNGNGFHKMWLNGELVVDDKGMNAYPEPNAPYWTMGIYGVSSYSTLTLWFDEIRVGDSSSSYKEVAPGGGTPSPLDTCQANGYQCCDTCQSEISHSEYDCDGQSSGQVCCEACEQPPETFEYIDKSLWSLLYADSEETEGEHGAATNAFDDNPDTIWHTEWYRSSAALPHEIQIDLGGSYEISGLSYLPRQDGNLNGTIINYALYISTDGVNWGSPVKTGKFTSWTSLQEVTFPSKMGSYVRLVALSEVHGNPWTSAAEIGIAGNPYVDDSLSGMLLPAAKNRN
ncbi:MAG: heparin lyase I family protein [Exilibacterium sp.]